MLLPTLLFLLHEMHVFSMKCTVFSVFYFKNVVHRAEKKANCAYYSLKNNNLEGSHRISTPFSSHFRP